ncbi:MAG TPA: TetR/AcrR family transcriptional regulator [Solirubrobacterales bacterium]|nr:TetR/AcrR family transcriptional regulator [Solirubrobacterales bacterium]
MEQGTRLRLNTAERREQLLAAGVELLSRRPHEDVSIEDIAAAAGSSKGLLYHYFPTKKDFILAAIERGQRELAARLRPDPGLPPEAQLDASLDAFLDYVEENATAFRAIFRGVDGDPEIMAALEAGRAEQMKTLMDALAGWEESPVSTDPSPPLETAIQGWLFFVDGAVLRWLEHGGLDRRQLAMLLKTALGGAVMAAAAGGAPIKSQAGSD